MFLGLFFCLLLLLRRLKNWALLPPTGGTTKTKIHPVFSGGWTVVFSFCPVESCRICPPPPLLLINSHSSPTFTTCSFSPADCTSGKPLLNLMILTNVLYGCAAYMAYKKYFCTFSDLELLLYEHDWLYVFVICTAVSVPNTMQSKGSVSYSCPVCLWRALNKSLSERSKQTGRLLWQSVDNSVAKYIFSSTELTERILYFEYLDFLLLYTSNQTNKLS